MVHRESHRDFGDELDELDGGGGFDLCEVLLYGVARQRLAIVTLGLMGLGVGIGYSLTLPNLYSAIGKIQVRLGEREQQGNEDAVDDDFDENGTRIGIADELELLDNPEVHRRVATQLGAERVLAPYDARMHDSSATPFWKRWLHGAQSWWFARSSPVGEAWFDPTSEDALFAAGLVAEANAELRSNGRNNFVYVTYHAHSPELARDAVNAYLDTAVAWHREVFEAAYKREFLEEELAEAYADANESMRRLSEHQEECQFYDIELQKEQLVDELFQIDRKLEEGRIRVEEIGEELAVIATELGELDPTIDVPQGPESVPNFAYSALVKRLESLYLELSGLDVVYNPASDVYRAERERIQEDIAALESQLDDLPPSREIGAERVRRESNPRLEELESSRAALLQERQRLTVSTEKWADARLRTDERLVAVLQCEPVHNLLQDDIGNTRGRARELSAQLEKANIMQRIDSEERMSNLNVTQRATLPTSKEGPSRAKFVAFGFLGGLALGVAYALLRQLTDPRLRYPNSLEKRLGIPVLGVVPEAEAWLSEGGAIRNKLVV